MLSRFQKWWNRGRFRPRRTSVSRRWFLLQGGVATALGGFIARHATRPGYVSDETGQPPIRPPGAGDAEDAFKARCIRCGLCGTVCENGCIRFYGLDEPDNGALTPFLDIRRRSCTLCMRCTQICPTGALAPIADEPEEILAHVAMGYAVVDPQRCLSYLGRVCGYCHDACPFPKEAIKLTPPARPFVLDACVGCGRCVEECPQNPTAIDIRRILS
jgi:ferredoxin-type protein NapF